MDVNLQKLSGHWNDGYALDIHTSSSVPIKDDEGNLIKFENTYTEMGELMNKLKYRGERQIAKIIADEANKAINSYIAKWQIDIIIPIPPSKNRSFQPVIEIAKYLSISVNLPIDLNALIKTRATPQMITINDSDERKKLLDGVFDVKENAFKGVDILLVDDLFRSGETLNAATDILKNKGKARGVFVLAITKTRVHR